MFGLLALLILLLVVCCFAPGFFLVRRLRWTPLEKLCGSVGLSLILLYLVAWAIYCFGPQDERVPFRCVAAIAVLLWMVTARDAWRLFRSFRVTHALAGFGFLLLWALVMLSMIRVYSGAGWSGDWYEHFHRSLFFLHRLPPRVVIFPGYALPARPPMMNVLAAFFLGMTDDRFALFQVVFAFLNTLLLFPCALLLPALGDRRRRGQLALMALLAASPVVMENATYSWTKSLAVFYVLLAVVFYLAGWRKRDSVRTVAAFVALAAALLIHYSAGPYVAFVAAHYVFRFYRERPRRWRELAGVAGACGLLLITWFAWSVKSYGGKTTLGSNTSVTSTRQYEGSNLEKIALNLFDTVVSPYLRGYPEDWPQGSPEGTLRDQAFVFYQLNLIFGLGSAGGLVVIWLLYSRLIRGKALPERVFWRWMVPCCIVVGIAVIGERDHNGQPHVTLLAIELLGITLLAANFRTLPKIVQFLLLAACCADFYFGIYLQARVESLENTPQHVVFPDPRYAAGRFMTAGDSLQSLGVFAWGAWEVKHRATILPRWLEELPRTYAGDPYFQRLWPEVSLSLENELADDAKYWDGWAKRHGGVEYLGDWVAGPSGKGTNVVSWIFALLFLVPMGMLARQSWSRQPVRTPARTARAREKSSARRAHK